MARPLISVIIPCYNLGRYLDEAVHSVCAQTYSEWEIIVIDDGSTDAYTRTLMSDYRRPKTRVLTADHGGVMRARNLGIANANGEYLCALDADDTLEPSYFEKAVRILVGDASIAFVSCWLRTFGDEEWTWRQERCDLATLLAECTVATPSLVRKAAVLAAGGFDERMPEQGYEDWDLWISLVERGFRGTILPEVLFNYRRRAASVSRACERPETHLRLMRYLMDKHRDSYQRHLFDLLVRKEAEASELLKTNYALEAYVDGWLRRVVELRREEMERLRAKREPARADDHWAACLEAVEREALRQSAEVQGLARERAALGNRVVDLETALGAAHEQIRALRGSRSWRLTAPLRILYEWLARAGPPRERRAP